MSAKCKYCKTQIYDETGQCWGEQLSDGTWECYFFDCRENLIKNIEELNIYYNSKISSIPCSLCNGDVVEYSIPNDIWNKVIRKNEHETDKEYLCINCFFDALRISLNIKQNKNMSGSELIAQERQRQIDEEGWSANHDDLLDRFQLSYAAITYLNPSNSDHIKKYWPFDWKWWKPARSESINDKYEFYHIKDLVKAGALIVAEIDRLQRLNHE